MFFYITFPKGIENDDQKTKFIITCNYLTNVFKLVAWY